MSEQPRPPKKLELPEDDPPTHLFVLAMAGMSILYNLYTGTVYENEVLVQEVESLSRISRDVDDSYQHRLAGELRRTGDLSDLGGERRLTRPPNMLTILVILLVGVGVIAYGAYSGQLGAWAASVSASAAYIVVGSLFGLSLIILVVWRLRNRRKKTV